MLAGFKIGVDVGASKTVNRLFRVADDNEAVISCIRIIDKNAFEYLPLNLVCILKFIHEGVGVPIL